jgi:hypothetical protein
MNTAALPYDLHAHGTGSFVVFESAEAVALPLFALSRATLRGDGGRQISLEFTHAQVVVEGAGLAELFAHLLAGRLKTIRCGRHEGCLVDRIQICDT